MRDRAYRRHQARRTFLRRLRILKQYGMGRTKRQHVMSAHVNCSCFDGHEQTLRRAREKRAWQRTLNL